MEDFENYKIFFYILIAVLYFLFSGKKKPKPAAKKNNPPKHVEVERPQSTQQKRPLTTFEKKEPYKEIQVPKKETEPFTLEDVLREFGTGKENKKVVEEVKKPSYQPLDFEDTKPVVVDYDENLEDEEDTPSLEIKRGEVTISGQDSHFDPYLLNKKQENKYAAFLSNPEGLKTAFVVQEILNRKHF